MKSLNRSRPAGQLKMGKKLQSLSSVLSSSALSLLPPFPPITPAPLLHPRGVYTPSCFGLHQTKSHKADKREGGREGGKKGGRKGERKGGRKKGRNGGPDQCIGSGWPEWTKQ